MSGQPPSGGPGPRPPVQRSPTRLESVDDIRAAIQARQAELLGRINAPPAGPQAAAPPGADAPGSPKTAPAAPAAPEASPFRPSVRPPVALLCVLDDDGDDGEWVRLRADRFVIGRTEGDLVLPHDPQISGRHAELVRGQDEDGWHWLLTDLGSTNGTFVRAGSALLKDGQEFLVGRSRYRFEAARAEPVSAPAPATTPGGTATWNFPGVPPGVPSLVEVTPTGPGERRPLINPEYWLGSDAAACAVVPKNDPYVNPRHARLARDAKGRWHIANHRSVNGVWLRVEQMPLAGSCQFQLGEQRFILRVPSP